MQPYQLEHPHGTACAPATGDGTHLPRDGRERPLRTVGRSPADGRKLCGRDLYSGLALTALFHHDGHELRRREPEQRGACQRPPDSEPRHGARHQPELDPIRRTRRDAIRDIERPVARPAHRTGRRVRPYPELHPCADFGRSHILRLGRTLRRATETGFGG